MGDPASSKNPSEDRPAQRSEVSKRTQKAPKADDVISTVTEDSFISFRKKFHFPNDLVMKVPTRTDRACFPPPGYVTVYEFSLRAGLRFPPSSELIDILTICGVCLSQFSYRAMSIVMGLIVLFRDRGVEKWGKLKELHVPLHIGAEDLLRILKLSDLDALHYEVRYLSRYVGLSTQAGRSHAQMLKKSARVPEVVPQKNHSKRPGSEEGLQAPRKKKADEVLTVVGKDPRYSDFKLEMTKTLNDWNKEFVKVKYLQGEYKKKYDSKVKEMKVEAQATIKQQEKAQQVLEAENERLQSVLSEKEAQQLPSAEARSHIYDVEVKALEAECAEDGFIRGFMKGVRTVHRKTGAEIEGLTPSQASGDASSDSGGEEMESELQRAFTLEEDEDDVEIL
ncbi:hypothetical protein IEQ34_018142 [Dendrobium chrysotoxum]|uniref:Uncharacterized protein n=1 Tax=Dendrobium chrysotoxum TaxID=161865 RepID=A0AAV7GDP6_DENCH|nr:hypothetical protein IEQ34_018142 [Dendrobium chrysotoxum]